MKLINLNASIIGSDEMIFIRIRNSVLHRNHEFVAVANNYEVNKKNKNELSIKTSPKWIQINEIVPSSNILPSYHLCDDQFPLTLYRP